MVELTVKGAHSLPLVSWRVSVGQIFASSALDHGCPGVNSSTADDWRPVSCAGAFESIFHTPRSGPREAIVKFLILNDRLPCSDRAFGGAIGPLRTLDLQIPMPRSGHSFALKHTLVHPSAAGGSVDE